MGIEKGWLVNPDNAKMAISALTGKPYYYDDVYVKKNPNDKDATYTESYLFKSGLQTEGIDETTLENEYKISQILGLMEQNGLQLVEHRYKENDKEKIEFRLVSSTVPVTDYKWETGETILLTFEEVREHLSSISGWDIDTLTSEYNKRDENRVSDYKMVKIHQNTNRPFSLDDYYFVEKDMTDEEIAKIFGLEAYGLCIATIWWL